MGALGPGRCIRRLDAIQARHHDAKEAISCHAHHLDPG
jgi:hypothetical protein